MPLTAYNAACYEWGPLMLKLLNILIFAVAASAANADQVVSYPAYETLRALYGGSPALLQPRDSLDPYHYFFSSELGSSPRERIRWILYGWREQRLRINERIGTLGVRPLPRSTVVLANLISRYVKSKIKSSRSDLDGDQKRDWDIAVEKYFQHFDLQGVTPKLSGLPFFSLAEKKFRDSKFQQQAISLHGKLVEFLNQLSFAAYSGQRASVDTSIHIWKLALEVCEGQHEEAIYLLGLLLSRDSTVLRYFNYINVENPEFILAVSETPVVVRLIVELLKDQFQQYEDRFSYNGSFSTTNLKNYYFWSSALVALAMKEDGYEASVAPAISARFAFEYKKISYLTRIAFAGFGMTGSTPMVGALIIDAASGLFPLVSTGAVAATLAAGRHLVEQVYRLKHGPRFYRSDAVQVARASAEGALLPKRCERLATDVGK